MNIMYSLSDNYIMKIPFHTVLGSMIRRNRQHINTFCLHPLLSFAPFYVVILGLLGTILSIFDIWRIIKCGPILPEYLHRQSLEKGKIISPEAERDCKLISLVFSAEYYFFLLIGLATNNAIFYMPFLTLNALIIFLEFTVFITKAFVEGLELQKRTIIMSLLMIYNWATVFCTFARSISCCDL